MRTVFILCFTSVCFAHSDAILRAIHTEKPPEIDGKLDEWDLVPAIEVHSFNVTFGTPLDDGDASYKVRAMWDESAIYLAFEVRDNSVFGERTGDRIYENDCVEICFDALHNSFSGYDRDDFQLVISAPKGESRIYRNPLLSQEILKEIPRALLLTSKGYNVEVRIPAKVLGVALQRGAVLGFQNDIRDYDASGSSSGISWVNDPDPAGNPLVFGHLFLAESPYEKLPDLRRHIALARSLLKGNAVLSETEATVRLGSKGGKLDFGFGWNLQFYDGTIPPWDEDTFNSFLRLLEWSSPHWIRYGVNLNHWEPNNDDNNPRHFNWEGFKFDSPIMKLHKKVLDFCEKRGIKVLIANWSAFDRASGASWLSEGPPAGGPTSPEEFIESISALIYYLKAIKRYECVEAVSLWNEPNLSRMYSSEKYPYPEGFLFLHRLLARRLRELSLADKIALLGPECSLEGNFLSLKPLSRVFSARVRFLGIHDYVSYFDWHRLHNSQSYEFGEKFLKSTPDLLLTECGNMGNGPNDVVGDREVYRGSVAVCEQILRFASVGVIGFARWEFRPYGVNWQNFGALTYLSRKYLFEPYRPVYFPHALLMKTTRRGSQMIPLLIEGARDSNGLRRLHGCAFKADDCLTVLLLNDADKSINVRLIVPGVLRLYQLSYDSTLPADFIREGWLKPEERKPGAEEGEFRFSIKPMSTKALLSSEEMILPPRFDLSPRVEPTYSESSVTFNFERPLEWHLWQSSHGSSKILTENSSLKIHYDFAEEGGEKPEQLIVSCPVVLDIIPKEVSLKIEGDRSGVRLKLLLLDGLAEHFSSPEEIRIDWKGWRQLKLSLKPLEDWGHWNGDGRPDLPLYGIGFVLEEPTPAFKAQGQLTLRALRLSK